MTPADLSRLRRWVGLPDSYLNFDPVGIEGDAQTLVEKMLGEGWQITVRLTGLTYLAVLRKAEHMPAAVEAPTRREALALVAMTVCP
jgi:hypothetical protein